MTIKKAYIIFTFLLLTLISTSQIEAQEEDVSSQITLANELYHEKNYPAAADIFEKLINQGETNGYLYYNLGNTYMRMGSTGRAILNYVRARSLIPRNESLDANLRYAVSQTQDKIPPPNNGIISDLLFWINSVSLIEHFGILLLSNLIFWCVCISSLYYRNPAWKSVRKISITIFLFVFFSSGMKYYHSTKQTTGVIIDQMVGVKSDRNIQNVTLFELHEGAIITINKEKEGWVNISVDTDKSGWLPIRSLGY